MKRLDRNFLPAGRAFILCCLLSLIGCGRPLQHTAQSGADQNQVGANIVGLHIDRHDVVHIILNNGKVPRWALKTGKALSQITLEGAPDDLIRVYGSSDQLIAIDSTNSSLLYDQSGALNFRVPRATSRSQIVSVGRDGIVAVAQEKQVSWYKDGRWMQSISCEKNVIALTVADEGKTIWYAPFEGPVYGVDLNGGSGVEYSLKSNVRALHARPGKIYVVTDGQLLEANRSRAGLRRVSDLLGGGHVPFESHISQDGTVIALLYYAVREAPQAGGIVEKPELRLKVMAGGINIFKAEVGRVSFASLSSDGAYCCWLNRDGKVSVLNMSTKKVTELATR